jgi:hypothetical protein
MAAGTAPEPGTVSPPKIREVTGWLMRHPDALDTHDSPACGPNAHAWTTWPTT